MPDLGEAKAVLRSEMARRRRRVSPQQAQAAGRAAAATLAGMPAFRRCERLALYAAQPGEVSTADLLLLGRSAHKVVLAPRCTEGGALEFAPFDRWSALRPGRYGILEPPPAVAAEALTAADLVVVPGVAFDPSGGRLGRGAGYYDRAFPAGLANCPVLFGLAFAFQLVPRVPEGACDRRVDAVLSERGVEGAVAATLPE